MQNITLNDIDIPFGRMVAIILKFMLASIPAVLLLYAIMGILTLIVFGFMGGAAAVLGGALESINQG